MRTFEARRCSVVELIDRYILNFNGDVAITFLEIERRDRDSTYIYVKIDFLCVRKSCTFHARDKETLNFNVCNRYLAIVIKLLEIARYVTHTRSCVRTNRDQCYSLYSLGSEGKSNDYRIRIQLT